VKRALLLLVLALAGCSYRHLIKDGEVDSKYLARIQTNVAHVTSLARGASVPYAVITEAEAREKFQRDLDRELPEERARSLAKALRAFGFVKGPLDVRRTMLDLFSEQAAGFYDPVEQKYFFVARHVPLGFTTWLACWTTDRDLPNEVTAAHELVHALQDRAFGLDAYWKAAGDDDDAQLARQAVIEGEAVDYGFLAMGLTKAVDLGREDLLEGGTGAAWERAPPVLRELLVFPYWAGYDLARAARHAKRDLWKDPPPSTAEVLHPEQVLARPAVAAPAPALGPEWKLVRENTLGAFLAGVLVGRADTPRWLGDRYRVYEDGSGRLALFWTVVFDQEAAAADFAKLYGPRANQKNTSVFIEERRDAP